MQLLLTSLPDFLRGALNTLIYCGVSFPLAVFLGLILAIMSGSALIWLQIPARFFIEVIRGTPIITQILLLYYGVGAILVQFDLSTWANAWVAGITSLALNYAAYEAEVFRAGIGSVDQGQEEAAYSLGMTTQQSFTRIVLPQSIPLMIPPLVNDFIYMLKDSAIVSVISGTDLASVMNLYTRTYSSSQMIFYLLVLLLYLLMSLPISWIGRYFEHRLRAAL
jgi:glutamine transport system permease protein